MIIKSAEFIKSAVKPDQYPQTAFPEIAFAGRSNVGKSSLINTLLNRKRLVKTSSTPGRTRLLNFFLVNQMFVLVDLPGFGYAKVPKAMQKAWKPMVETYLASRHQLQGVVLLMDIRRTPGQEEINLLARLAHLEIQPLVILTKSDKISKMKQQKQKKRIAAHLDLSEPELILFSSKTRLGFEAVWDRLETLLNRDIGRVSGS